MPEHDKIYWIGGSPCSGKSTIAEMLSERLGMTYFKLDDRLDRLTAGAAALERPYCKSYLGMSPDEIWMREPAIQCAAETAICWELFDLAAQELAGLDCGGAVITEGAGWLPELVHGYGVRPNRYVCIVPEREFQFSRYAQRPWISHILEGCADKKAAFANWMERDALFARYAAETARALGYEVILVDGTRTPEEIFARVCEVFGL